MATFCGKCYYCLDTLGYKIALSVTLDRSNFVFCLFWQKICTKVEIKEPENSKANTSNPSDVILKCDNSDDVSDKVMIKVEEDESSSISSQPPTVLIVFW